MSLKVPLTCQTRSLTSNDASPLELRPQSSSPNTNNNESTPTIARVLKNTNLSFTVLLYIPIRPPYHSTPPPSSSTSDDGTLSRRSHSPYRRSIPLPHPANHPYLLPTLPDQFNPPCTSSPCCPWLRRHRKNSYSPSPLSGCRG